MIIMKLRTKSAHTMKEGSKVPRRGFTAKREVLPDPIYNDVVVTKLINNIMLDGKKGVAQKIVYDAFALVNEKTGKDALEAFKEAMDNIMPVLEVKARRVGGATYQVPMEVRPERRQTLGIRWLRRTRHSHTIVGNTESIFTERRKLLEWLEKFHWKIQEILVLWLTSMPVRQQPQREFYITPVKSTRWVKHMTVQEQWTGWLRSRNVVSQSHQLLQLLSGRRRKALRAVSDIE